MVVTKEILNQYSDLRKECEEVREKIDKLERQIEKIEAEGVVVDKVTGGSGGVQSFKIEGFPYPEYSRKKTLLYARKATLSELEWEISETINKVEVFIASIKDSHMRRIVTFRVVDGLSWESVARKMGGANNENNIKKAYQRFMESN